MASVAFKTPSRGIPSALAKSFVVPTGIIPSFGLFQAVLVH